MWRSREVFLPAYADLETLVYLLSLGARQPGVAVVPVYGSAPIYFRSNHVVFLSTGFILKAGSESELTEVIQTHGLRSRHRFCRRAPQWRPRCPQVSPTFSNGWRDNWRDTRIWLCGGCGEGTWARAKENCAVDVYGFICFRPHRGRPSDHPGALERRGLEVCRSFGRLSENRTTGSGAGLWPAELS